jgi:hypothetical protein
MLRTKLIAELTDAKDAKIDAQPMVAASQSDLLERAASLGYDYVLTAEVTELKVSKPGAFGGIMRAASGMAGGASPPKDTTESSVVIKLVQPDGKQRLSTTTKGKDGSGFSLKTGLALASFAGSIYMGMFMGPGMMSRLNLMGMSNLGGLGMLGNPALLQLQSGMYGGGGRGLAIDATAGAASFLMQQGFAMNEANPVVGAPGGPSFEASIGEALDGAAKAVVKAVRR